jgi:probable HAF family extracellular repeat protein
MSQNSSARTCRRVMRASQLVLVLCAVLFAARAATAFVIVDLGTLGGTDSYAQAVNAGGQVVGASFLPGNRAEGAFLWTEANGMIPLETLGGTDSLASAINADGLIVGGSSVAGGAEFRAVLWTPTGTYWTSVMKPSAQLAAVPVW